MKVTLDLSPDIEDEIVLKSLKWAIDDLSNSKYAIFHKDRARDKKAIKEHVKALDLIIKYYSVG